jgi:hypothetical protein
VLLFLRLVRLALSLPVPNIFQVTPVVIPFEKGWRRTRDAPQMTQMPLTPCNTSGFWEVPEWNEARVTV